MSRDLLRRGFKFVGPTICQAFMQAVGMVNDHGSAASAMRQSRGLPATPVTTLVPILEPRRRIGIIPAAMANERNTASPEQLLAQVEWVRRIRVGASGAAMLTVVQQAYSRGR